MSVRLISGDGVWCWFQDPRAVQYNGKTYVGWVNSYGDIQICACDNLTGRVLRVTTLAYGLNIDDHAAPAILIRSDGHLMVFYSAHSGTAMYYATSTRPEDISSWEPTRAIPDATFVTYPQPLELADGTIFISFRAMAGFSFTTTIDKGVTWSPTKLLVNFHGYLKTTSNGKDKVFFAFTRGAGGTSPGYAILFCYYQTGAFYKMDGTRICSEAELPMSPVQMDLIYDMHVEGEPCWIWDIALDRNENPYVVFATFPSFEEHHYRYGLWDGNQWIHRFITEAGPHLDGSDQGYYAGGLSLDSKDPTTVYLARQVDGVYEIEEWKTMDEGLTWSMKPITQHSDKDNMRPVCVRNYASNFRVVWFAGDYPTYVTYNTKILGFGSFFELDLPTIGGIVLAAGVAALIIYAVASHFLQK